jgi:hypothetical protein
MKDVALREDRGNERGVETECERMVLRGEKVRRTTLG